MVRRVCIVLCSQLEASFRVVENLISNYGYKYSFTILIDSTSPLIFSVLESRIKIIRFDYNSINLIKLNLIENRYDVVCDFGSPFSGSVLFWARKSGTQVRILCLNCEERLRSSYRNVFLLRRNASKIFAIRNKVADKILRGFDEYYLNFKDLDGLSDLNRLSEILCLEFDKPLRALDIRLENPFINFIWKLVMHYDHHKYWKLRYNVVHNKNVSKLWKLYSLYRIKRMDAFHNSSFGTSMNSGAQFETMPYLPHGPNGIIVGHDCKIGKEVTIFHQVTIMHGGVIIGNNVILGAGAKILPGVRIGANVKVGANCVVVEDIPDGATVVLTKPRIIQIDENK